MVTVNNAPAVDGGRFKWAQPAVVAAAVGLMGIAYLLSGTVHSEASRAAAVLAGGDLASLRDYIRSFGAWAPVISLLLMLFQALAAPIPSFVVVFANGLAFGLWWGWVLSLVGQVLAAAICFWLARTLGRGPVSAVVGRFGLDSADAWFARWGAHAVLVTRLVPGMAFDSVSYAAGLTRMSFARFIVATALGSAPSTLLYTYLGQRAPQFGWVLLAATLLLTASFTLPAFVRSRRSRERDATPPPPASWMTKRQLLEASRLHLAVVALLGLLVYLLMGQIVTPGFTDYWGYLLVQIAVVTAAMLGLNRATAATGGLSWITCLIVVGAVYADTFGNAAGMYERYAAFDKFVHAIGTAALAVASYELLVALHPWRTDGLCAVAAVGVAMTFAVGWEVYEFGADRLFATYRHAGTLDTAYDLIFDAIGAVAMSVLMRRREIARPPLGMQRARKVDTPAPAPAIPESPVGYPRCRPTTVSHPLFETH